MGERRARHKTRVTGDFFRGFVEIREEDERHDAVACDAGHLGEQLLAPRGHLPQDVGETAQLRGEVSETVHRVVIVIELHADQPQSERRPKRPLLESREHRRHAVLLDLEAASRRPRP